MNRDTDFIQDALNFYWNDAHINLQRKDLGDLERINYQYQLDNSKRLMEEYALQSKGEEGVDGNASLSTSLRKIRLKNWKCNCKNVIKRTKS